MNYPNVRSLQTIYSLEYEKIVELQTKKKKMATTNERRYIHMQTFIYTKHSANIQGTAKTELKQHRAIANRRIDDIYKLCFLLCFHLFAFIHIHCAFARLFLCETALPSPQHRLPPFSPSPAIHQFRVLPHIFVVVGHWGNCIVYTYLEFRVFK